jgi:APA family basic amino acid/polyamine antiporter
VTVAAETGIPGLALLVWLVAGILSLLGALTFAELGASRPDSGGMYAYLKDAFGPLVAFLYGWTMFLVIGSGSLATLAAAFPRYVAAFVPLSPAASTAASVLVIAAVTAINVRGTRQSADVQALTTALKVAVIVVMAAVLTAIGGAATGPGDWWPAKLSLTTITNGVTAMIGVLWAYEGWQYATFSAGETIDPQRVFARGMIAGTAILVGVYVFANVGYLSALGVDGVASSGRVASDAAAAALGPGIGLTRMPARCASATMKAPGSARPGVPASLTSATFLPSRSAAISLGAAARSLCSCSATVRASMP